ncbi:hypothetical protein Pmani_008964 [Petrolisthes manimaculis]|uniref:Uncharacterized protein n=1 Tax=Petrolisthes manimaculis TaxID=1843537 RepID=A0AAE1Q616_9EUCA|nr:hypothetical protein Pmani_015600 [Petrolisthes manimaculis]KAK4320155.1 hypothetical protein Pmani_008964 [Petrolisthes manimaculis]
MTLLCRHGSSLIFNRIITLTTRTQPLQRHLPNVAVTHLRHKTIKASPDNETIDLDKPFKFSTSRAATWKARQTFGGPKTEEEDQLWYQPFVVLLSLGVFLVYFCILREENDLDSKLNKTLYDHIEGLEEKQLELSLDYSSDPAAIIQRLEELKAAKEAGSDSQSHKDN